MDAREILNRVRSGELDLGSASAQLRGTEPDLYGRSGLAPATADPRSLGTA